MGILNRAWPTLSRDIILNKVLASALIPLPLRWKFYRAAGMDVARSVICPNVWFGSRNIVIGEGTFINYRCVFNTHGGIAIGRNCDIAMDVSFVTSTHEPGTPERRAGESKPQPIIVGNGVWIGTRAVILPGVTIGDGAVIAAGAVVTRDCEPHTLYAGVPALPKSGLSRPS
ncbi:acyltransferase [Paenarthrobacter nitroguajacolicus]|uniref:acyltransferase n=1 Tax=Paenarthrobacter nitroguajacolicus TaxID=211146 RepID=UPI0015BE864F|nr:acyltransferase [Paenarthrobacter nitroguajacolicus]NWL35189.1 acetyltransferase [Paenarthrobacter nitroguajacolicus]